MSDKIIKVQDTLYYILGTMDVEKSFLDLQYIQLIEEKECDGNILYGNTVEIEN